jgi:hypothetical protein
MRRTTSTFPPASLARQLRGCEGLAFAAVASPPPDLRGETSPSPDALVDGNTAAAAVTVHAPGDDEQVSKITYLVDGQAEVRGHGEEILPPTPDAVVAVIGRPDRAEWRDLHFSIEEREIGVKVAPPDGVYGSVEPRTFSCDIGYSDSPTASRACSKSAKARNLTTLPSLTVQT